MADEVKVKFGGDFTDVPKGADAAAKQAGTAIANSFSDAAGKASKMFLGAFAVSNIVSSIYSGMREAGQYFLDLQNTLKKTGANAQDLQALGKAGKESGVGLDAIGNALVKTNKFLNEATKGGDSQLETLRSLGFATDQASVANIKAIDVFYKLADEIKRTGDATKYTETIIKIFGKSGAELIPVLEKGSDELKELAESSKLYTEAEIKAGVAAERAAKAGEIAWNNFIRRITSWFGGHEIQEDLSDAFSKSIKESFENQAKTGPEGSYSKQDLADIYSNTAKDVLKAGKKLGLNQDEILDYANKTFGSEGGIYRFILGASDSDKVYAALEEMIQEINENKDFTAPAEENIAKAIKSTSVVSSLQAIGAGDIQSIFAGTYQDQMLDAQTRTASATEQVVKNTTPPTNPVEEPPARAGH